MKKQFFSGANLTKQNQEFATKYNESHSKFTPPGNNDDSIEKMFAQISTEQVDNKALVDELKMKIGSLPPRCREELLQWLTSINTPANNQARGKI